MDIAPAPHAAMPLCQIAISTTQLQRSHWWYRRAFGFLAAGHPGRIEEPGAACVPDLPECWLDVWWLVGRQPWVQFEMMEFQRPQMRRMPDDWRPSDVGYSTIGLRVEDFDAALRRLQSASGRLIGPVIGSAGQRRTCLRDPDGILLELMEDEIGHPIVDGDARADVPVSVRSVTLCVPCLDTARAFWIDALGLREIDVRLHGPEHEALWGLDGARRRSLVLEAGPVVVELVEYAEPASRARPSGYLLSDQGILNVAFGSTDRAHFDAVYRRVKRGGFRSNSTPWTKEGVATVVYVNDGQGSSVELMHVEPHALDRMGFTPARRAGTAAAL